MAVEQDGVSMTLVSNKIHKYNTGLDSEFLNVVCGDLAFIFEI